MGQYWYPVNLTRREFIHPHKLGSGFKLWEQVASHPGVGAALVILCAAMPERRGGGDLSPIAGDVNEKIVGRWAGDRIVLVGDYAEDGDLADSPVPASHIYDLCSAGAYGAAENAEWLAEHGYTEKDAFRDVSELVCQQIEKELDGKFTGTGWRRFVENGETVEAP
jgi:hypothetical protein